MASALLLYGSVDKDHILDGAAVIAAGAVLVTGGGALVPVLREQVIVDDIGGKQRTVTRLKQICQVAVVSAPGVGIDHHRRQGVHPGRQFNQVGNAVIVVKILRADPGVLQKRRLVLGICEEFPAACQAHTGDIALAADALLVGNGIVVEGCRL